jgi:hypothetical protein
MGSISIDSLRDGVADLEVAVMSVFREGSKSVPQKTYCLWVEAS